MSLSLNWKDLQSTSKIGKIAPATKKQKKKPNSISALEKLKKEKQIVHRKSQPSGNDNSSALKLLEEGQKTVLSIDELVSKVNLLKNSIPLVDPDMTDNKKKPGKYVAMDCEFVGIGENGSESALARVSIVNYYGYVLLDEYVKPNEHITDFRTFVSGITPRILKEKGISFKEAQKHVDKLLEGKILVGHAVNHDLEVLFLSHPKANIRDTSRHVPYRNKFAGGKTPSLKKLSKEILNIEIQAGKHSSVEDAQATMLLFRLRRKAFELKN